MTPRVKALCWFDLKLIAAAAGLGFMFNTMNPVGLTWGNTPQAEAAPRVIQPSTPLAEAAPTGSPYQHEILKLDIGLKADPADDPYRMTWLDARPEMIAKEKLFVDIRPTAAYQTGKIEGALSFPTASAQTLLPLLVKTIGTDKGLIVGCIQEGCAAAKAVLAVLRSSYEDVKYVEGEDPEWDRLTGRRVEVTSNGATYANLTVSLTASGAKKIARPTAQAVPVRPTTAQPPRHQHNNIHIPSVTWKEIAGKVEAREVLLVDGRTGTSFETGHIPQAYSLPYAEFTKQIETFKSAYPPDTPITTYCANANCPIAHHMAVQLKAHHGFTNVTHMPGGYIEWLKSSQQNPK